MKLNYKRASRFLAPLFFFLINFLLSDTTQAQWVKTMGPEGISVNKFYEDGSYLYAGTYAKGVFRSSDHGIHWEPANAGMENALVYSFTSDLDYLYAGVQGGVYRSTDHGSTWELVNAGINQQAVNEMEIGNGYLFAGTIGSGVFRSADQGATWTSANGGALNSSFIMAMVYVDSKLMVEADNYVFYTFDDGNSWFIDQGNTAFYPIQNFFAAGDTLYASAYGGVFYSYDGGNNWSNFITLNPDFNSNVLGFAVSNDTVFAGINNGMYFSVDFGQNWSYIPENGLRFGSRFNNHFIKSGNNYLLGMDELGIYISSDKGSNWLQAVKGFTPASTIDNSMITIDNEIWTGTHTNGVFKTTNNGSVWNKTGTSNDQDSLSNAIVFAMLNADGGIILAGTCGFGLYRSPDNGLTWTHITTGLPWSSGGYECDYSLGKVGSNLLLGTSDGLYYSTDLGITWNATNLAGNNYNMEAIATNGNIVIAALSNGNGAHPTGIYQSTNNGVTWNFQQAVYDVVSLAGDGVNHFYAGSLIGDNYRSSDNGASWNTVGPGIPTNAGGFTIKAIGDNVFIGNSAGVYYSSDKGATFSNASDGLDGDPNDAVQGLASNDQYIFAGLFHDAVWKRPLSDFGIVATATNDVVTNSLVLYQNTPNPFSQSTLIQYYLPLNTDATVTITDVTGKIIFEQHEKGKSAGLHTIDFKNKDLADGIYFAQLQANGAVKVIKMIVER